MQFADLVDVDNLHQQYVNSCSTEGWIYREEGQRSRKNPGFSKFCCLDMGTSYQKDQQVIRKIQKDDFDYRLLQSSEADSVEPVML